MILILRLPICLIGTHLHEWPLLRSCMRQQIKKKRTCLLVFALHPISVAVVAMVVVWHGLAADYVIVSVM